MREAQVFIFATFTFDSGSTLSLTLSLSTYVTDIDFCIFPIQCKIPIYPKE